MYLRAEMFKDTTQSCEVCWVVADLLWFVGVDLDFLSDEFFLVYISFKGFWHGVTSGKHVEDPVVSRDSCDSVEC